VEVEEEGEEADMEVAEATRVEEAEEVSVNILHQSILKLLLSEALKCMQRCVNGSDSSSRAKIPFLLKFI
jgi:hypothetical protein